MERWRWGIRKKMQISQWRPKKHSEQTEINFNDYKGLQKNTAVRSNDIKSINANLMPTWCHLDDEYITIHDKFQIRSEIF